ncbi:zinc ribbon domain-containing protein [Chryseobacterium sp. RG1]|uniref:Zinc ribbon domain-containing protein n=1 Tax=Chryseobacterium tagetis TaxID=2801334 RepID=A0ABS8A0F3_9FLAO|nr:zinc-ribbon domain-containing protein [Chryseobacterium tagetis]MCA6067438.1 zinc ribbon domain-containing protein [Chryseobacterium tagetis]
MLFLFGTGKSTLKNQYPLHQCTCPNCHQTNTMIAGTVARYFHFFFLPVFPTSKDNIAICRHCNANFSYGQFTDEMKQAFDSQYNVNPNSRPIWHGCGCFLILMAIFFFVVLLIIGWFKSKDEPEKPEDKREAFLKTDIHKTKSKPSMETDSTSFYIKECLDGLLQDELDKNGIGYFSKQNGNKILIILHIDDMKKIKSSERHYMISIVKKCLELHEGYEDKELYIGIDGRWNMVLVSTPNGSDTKGKFADETLLLPFYDKPQNDIETVEIKKDSNDVNREGKK